MTRQRLLDRLAEVLAALLLVAQLGGVLRGITSADSFFTWAPHDERMDYRIIAFHQGRAIPPGEILGRYGRAPVGTMWHRGGDLFRIVEVAEGRVRPARRWDLWIEYRVNLGPWELWER